MAEFQFRCPQCQKTVSTDDSYKGQVAECPFCGKGIVVPSSITAGKKILVRRARTADDIAVPNSITTGRSQTCSTVSDRKEEHFSARPSPLELAARSSGSEARERFFKMRTFTLFAILGVGLILINSLLYEILYCVGYENVSRNLIAALQHVSFVAQLLYCVTLMAFFVALFTRQKQK